MVEYVSDNVNLDDRDHECHWAIFMGNSMIMRYCGQTKSVVCESYWRLAYRFYIYVNRELDKKFITLPIYEILKRARNVHTNNATMARLFNSDKNFAFW